MSALKISLLASCITMVIGCTKTAPINGTYVMSFKNEYSIATDTMIIKPYDEAAGTYQIERRDGFHRIRDGKVLPKEFKQQSWIATYEADKQLLQGERLWEAGIPQR